MSTKIEWADVTWNVVTGCTKISPGCQNCYAERMSKRLAGRCGYPEDEPFRVTLHPEKLEEPLKWKKPRRVFVCSMGDLFHDNVPFEFIKSVFTIMNIANQHTFQVLTKRPQRMLQFIEWYQKTSFLDDTKFEDTFPNVWLGVTAENQQMADERIPVLLQIPAAVRFVSIEPMLGPVDLTRIPISNIGALHKCDALRGYGGWGDYDRSKYRLNWVICGTESGPGRRPADVEWIRGLRDQCTNAGVSFFLKQMEVDGRLVKMPELDGQVWAQFPEVSSR